MELNEIKLYDWAIEVPVKALDLTGDLLDTYCVDAVLLNALLKPCNIEFYKL